LLLSVNYNTQRITCQPKQLEKS